MTETRGVHHVGLTVSKLEQSADFFTRLLGWQVVRRNEEYPAIFVSDGQIMITLWAVKESPEVSFNKNRNVGLHHLALRVGTEEALNALHQKLLSAGIQIEFGPELLGKGPAKHMMCYDPSGIRLEFTWPGN